MPAITVSTTPSGSSRRSERARWSTARTVSPWTYSIVKKYESASFPMS